MLWVTFTREDISTLSLSSTAKSVVSPTPTPVRYISRGDFTSTSATSGLATKSELNSSSTRISWPVPTTSETLRSASGATSSKASVGTAQEAGRMTKAAARVTARGR